MSTTGLPVFDTTVQETNLWLKSLMEKLHSADRQFAYSVLRASLHGLRDRIGPENAVHLGAQLPLLLRGVFYEGWRLSEAATRERHVPDFLDHVRRELPPGSDHQVEAGVRAAFDVMWERLDPGEVTKVVRRLPAELKELWPPIARGS